MSLLEIFLDVMESKFPELTHPELKDRDAVLKFKRERQNLSSDRRASKVLRDDWIKRKQVQGRLLQFSGKKLDARASPEQVPSVPVSIETETVGVINGPYQPIEVKLPGQSTDRGEQKTLFGELWTKIKNGWSTFLYRVAGKKVFPTFTGIGAMNDVEFFSRREKKVLGVRKEGMVRDLVFISNACNKKMEGPWLSRSCWRNPEEGAFLMKFARLAEIDTKKTREILEAEVHLKSIELANFVDGLYTNKQVIKAVDNIFFKKMEWGYGCHLMSRSEIEIKKGTAMEHYALEYMHLRQIYEALTTIIEIDDAVPPVLDLVEKAQDTAHGNLRRYTICQDYIVRRFSLPPT